MRFVLVTNDPEVQKEAELAFDRIGELKVFARWQEALNAMQSVDLMFVDLVATLEEPHKIAGYEKFANAKMIHDVAKDVKLVLIAAPQGYDLDFMVGYPDFLFAQLPRPVTHKMLLRMSTYV